MALNYKYEPYKPKLPEDLTLGKKDESKEKAIKSLEAQRDNLEKRFEQVGEKPEPNRNVFEKLLNLPAGQGPIMDFIEIMNRPVEATKGFVSGLLDDDPSTDAGEEFFRGLSGERGMTSFSEEIVGKIFKTNTDNWNGIVKFAVDFAGDMALDPLTYVPAGAFLTGGKKLLKIGSKTVSATLIDAAYSAGKIINTAKKGGRAGARAKKLIMGSKLFTEFKEKLAKKSLTGAAGEVGEKATRDFYQSYFNEMAKKAGLGDDIFEVVQMGGKQVNGRNLKDLDVWTKYVDQATGVVDYVKVATIEAKSVIDITEKFGTAFALNTTFNAADLAAVIAGKGMPKGASLGRQFLEGVKDVMVKYNGQKISIPELLLKNANDKSIDVLNLLSKSTTYVAPKKHLQQVTQAISGLFFDDLAKSGVDYVAFRIGQGVDDFITLSLEGARRHLRFTGRVGVKPSNRVLTKNVGEAVSEFVTKNINKTPIADVVGKGSKLVKRTLTSIKNTTKKGVAKTFKGRAGQLVLTGINVDDAANLIGKVFNDADGLAVEILDVAKIADNEFVLRTAKKTVSGDAINLLSNIDLFDDVTGKRLVFADQLRKIDETEAFAEQLIKGQKANVEEISLLSRLAQTQKAVKGKVAIQAPKFVTKSAEFLKSGIDLMKGLFDKGAGFTKKALSKLLRIAGRSGQFVNQYSGRLARYLKELEKRGISRKVATQILESGGQLVKQADGTFKYVSKRAYSVQEIFENLKLNIADGRTDILLPSFGGKDPERLRRLFENRINKYYSESISELDDGVKAFIIKKEKGSFAIKVTDDFKERAFKRKYRTLLNKKGFARKNLDIGEYFLDDATLKIWRENQDIISDFATLRDDVVRVMKEELGFHEMAKILEGKQGYLRHTLTDAALDIKKKAASTVPDLFSKEGLDLLRNRTYLGTADEVNKAMKAFYGYSDDIFDMDIQRGMEDLIQITGQKLEQHKVLNMMLKGSDDTGKSFFQVVTIKGPKAQTEASRLSKDFVLLKGKETFEGRFSKLFAGLDPQTKKVLSTYFVNKGAYETLKDGTTRILKDKAIAIQKASFEYLTQLNRAYMELPGFVKGYDKFLNAWKSVTLVSPGYHLRNLLGNMTNSYLAGMNVAQQLRYSLKAFKDFSRFKVVNKRILGLGTEEIKETFIRQLGKEAGEKKIRRLTFEGVLERPDRWDVEDLVRFDISQKEAESFRRVIDFKESGAAQSHRGFRDLESVKKSLGKGKRLDQRIVKLNYNAAEAADDYQRYMLYQWAYDKSFKGSRKLGMNTVERTIMAQGDASTKVSEALFDYSHLTGFEKEYMKRLFPFYTFFKNNIIFQAKNMIARPGKYARLGRAYKGYVEDIAGMDLDAMPDYMQDNMWLPIPMKVTKDDKEAISFLKANLPVSDYLQIVENPFREGMNFLSAPVKLPLELGSGKEIFTGREFQGTLQAMSLDDGVAPQLGPFIRDDKGNLSFRDGTMQKIALELGLRVPMNYASVILDMLDTAFQKQSFGEGTTDFFTRLGVVGTQTEQNLRLTDLYQDLEKLRASRKEYERITGERLPGKEREKKKPEVPGLDEYLRSLGGRR